MFLHNGMIQWRVKPPEGLSKQVLMLTQQASDMIDLNQESVMHVQTVVCICVPLLQYFCIIWQKKKSLHSTLREKYYSAKVNDEK